MKGNSLRDNASKFPDFPLIVLNGEVYKGDLNDLKVKIRHIGIYKGPGETALYGISAANGVIMISTEKNVPRNFAKPSTDTSFDGRVVYIIDGQLSENNHVDKVGVLVKSSVKGAELKNIQGRKLDSIVTIVTWYGAIDEYEKKLSRFSDEYKNYVLANHGDRSIIYTLLDGKGRIYDPHGKDFNLTRELYQLPEDKIKTVNFSVTQTCCGINRFCVVEIKQ